MYAIGPMRADLQSAAAKRNRRDLARREELQAVDRRDQVFRPIRDSSSELMAEIHKSAADRASSSTVPVRATSVNIVTTSRTFLLI